MLHDGSRSPVQLQATEPLDALHVPLADLATCDHIWVGRAGGGCSREQPAVHRIIGALHRYYSSDYVPDTTYFESWHCYYSINNRCCRT